MRSLAMRLSMSAAVLVGTAAAAAAENAAQAPRADARVLRALDSNAETFRVVVGMRDGTPSARQLRDAPDPENEPARRIVRLEAQQRLADEMPLEEFRVRHFYGSFSFLSATVTRAALLALANRPDVDWITLDGKKHALTPEGSPAQALIKSDQANGHGATGAGQVIAILDTGVDYGVSAMGGGGFPNAKVIGGTDTADNDEDPMDCEGHGTSVASVAASASGVAPDAKIVAIKVFSSKDANNAACEDSADDSDILAGVDWALSHRAQLGIGILNLSLGGGFEDTLDHGYCDTDVPDYAAAFDASLAAGVVVVVASGNDGTTNALAAPACVSSAISVGAVYSDSAASRTWLDDTGGEQCTDAPATPDHVVCFSNSATSLSLLAPGAFWVVAKKGNGVNLFAGTSAAAPAASGSVAALRQMRPAISPRGVADVLRATGTPITDPRNAIATPRIDALAAITLDPNSFFSAAQSVLPAMIPDGTGSGSVPIMVSGPTGTVSGLEVLVEIDHPDPQQLQVTLHAPNGTSVVLHDQTGQHEHPINAIYGTIDEPAESLGAFQGAPVAGLWTLTVEDVQADVPTHSGRIVNFGLLMTSSVTSTRSVGARAASHDRETRTVPARRGGRPGSSATALSAPAEATTPASTPRPRPEGPERVEPEPQR